MSAHKYTNAWKHFPFTIEINSSFSSKCMPYFFLLVFRETNFFDTFRWKVSKFYALILTIFLKSGGGTIQRIYHSRKYGIPNLSCLPHQSTNSETTKSTFDDFFPIDRLRLSLVQLCHVTKLNEGRTQSVNWLNKISKSG